MINESVVLIFKHIHRHSVIVLIMYILSYKINYSIYTRIFCVSFFKSGKHQLAVNIFFFTHKVGVCMCICVSTPEAIDSYSHKMKP